MRGGALSADEVAQSPSPSSVKSLSNGALKGTLLADASGTSRNSQNAEQIPQASGETQTFQLDETVITATGYEQDIKYAPASISVVPKEDIVSRPVKDLGDIVQDVPGVSIDTAKTGVSTINLRGMHAEYTLILIDGKRVSPSKGMDSNGYYSNAGYMPPLSMIERVEVIKGPSSLRYGSEAMGGVVNIITKKTPDKTTASIGLETKLQENHSEWGHTYGFNGTIFHPINEMFAINLRGKISYQEENHINDDMKYDAAHKIWVGASGHLCIPTSTGTRHNSNCANPYSTQAPAAYQTASVGGRLIFTPDEQNTFYLDTDFNFQRIGTLKTSPTQIGEKRDYERFNVLLNHDGEYSFGSINTYAQFNSISKITHYDINYGMSEQKNYQHGRNHSTLVYNPNFSLASTFTKNFDFGNAGALIVNAGPSYLYERMYDRSEGTNQRGYQVAVFGEGEYLPFDWFGLTAGVRVNYALDYGVYAAPRAYLNFYPTSWLTLKAGFANGFQVPDLSMRYDGYYEYSTRLQRYYYGNKDLKMEKTYNYEVSALVDTPFANFSLTGYITDYKDAIDSTTFKYNEKVGSYICNVPGMATTESCSITINVDEARLWGAELAINSKALLTSLFTRWNGGIFVDLGYAYTDTERKTGADKGKPLNDIPLHTLSAKLSYKTPNWQLYTRYRGTFKKHMYNSMSAKPGAAEINTFFAQYGQYLNGPGYYKDIHIVDLGTSYRFENGITLSFVINNLLDKDYEAYYNWAANDSKSAYGMYIPGRNYWLNVSADF